MTAQAAQAKQPTLLGRAARMLLVFLLVFGMSFRAEMALAADKVETTDLKGHEVGTLANLAVCKVDENKKVDVEDGVVRTLVNMSKDEKDKGLTLEYGESVVLAAAPKWKGEEEFEAAAAEYVEWKIGDKDADGPTIKIENDGTYDTDKPVTVTCTVSKDFEDKEGNNAQEYLVESLEEYTKITFPITMEPKPLETHKVVGEMNCLLTGDGLTDKGLTLSLDQANGYRLVAKVTADIDTVDSDGNIVSDEPEQFTYLSDSGKDLSTASDGLFADLTWELLDDKQSVDPSIASIDNGVLSVSKDCSFIVQCTLADAAGKNSLPVQVSVTCGDETSEEPGPGDSGEQQEPQKADQGDDHSQPSLHVTGRVPVAAMTDEAAASDGASEASESTESGESGETTSTEAGVEAAESSTSSSSSSSESDEVKELDQTFTVAEIEALESAEETFTMSTAASGEITVTGKGPKLDTLFKSMGIENLEAINEIKFTDYAKGEVTVSWSALTNALLAVKSYVHDPESASSQEGEATSSSSAGEGEGSGSTENAGETEATETEAAETEATESKSELLDNTRFRILSNALSAAGIDADSLRWVAEIEINPGKKVEPEPEPEPEPDPEPDPEAPFSVSVGYAPSPIGQEAVFWPVPSKEIAGATFEYTWEESADGTNWDVVSENPTYRTITSEDRIGHQFRVTLTSDMVDETTKEKLKDTSDPVPMRAGWGISLVFDPPLAGDVATFNVKFAGFPSGFDFGSLDYIWELSTDGCETWQLLASQYQGKSTLSIQTDPISESDSNADVTPVYIRCRVAGEALKPVTDTTAEIAGPQMLTVHTGDGTESKPNTPENAKPANIVKDDSSKSKTKKKGGTASDDDVFADDVEFEGSDDDETATALSPDGSLDQSDGMPQLHINDDVTEQIIEQEEAVQEQIEQTVPGARWTSLNTTQPSGDDVQGILADNPFAPFAIPMGLGITVAGGLEKLLAFRRQL